MGCFKCFMTKNFFPKLVIAMNKSKALFLSALLVLLVFIGCREDTIDFVQLGVISGVVYDDASNEPLEGVEITTIPATSVIYTDSLGEFTLNKVASGDYRVRTNLENYKSETVSITVSGNGEAVTTLYLTLEEGILKSAVNPIPADDALNVGTLTQLNWQNPNESSLDVSFDIQIYEASTNTLFIEFQDVSDTLVNVENLKFNTGYFWQVTTKNDFGELEYSKLWKFTTLPLPDNRILYTSLSEDGFNEIFSLNESGTNPVRLTYSNQDKFGPLYNPDRSKIAYIAITGLESHLFVISNEGRNPVKITTLPLDSYHQQGRGFSWSPDGSKLVYCHYEKLLVINNDGTGLMEIATAPANRQFRSVDWGQANNQLIVETIGTSIYDGEIYLMNADGSGMIQLVSNEPGIIENPSLSIDGQTFLYTRDFSGNETLQGRQLDARILSAPIVSPGTITDLSQGKTNGTNDLYPTSSSDGSKIIFVNSSNDGSGASSIYLMDFTDGANRTELVSEATFPSWK